ncbi:MAG TPA: S1/P1 nuclease [Gemmatimonadales bacterium]|nr:S1/P1 nuclease [Gemmatimonadales bacterium]
MRSLVLGSLAALTFFWGPEGHQIVARVAEARLTPAARAEATRLLGGQSIADVASWADNVRSQRPETGAWHYVDIELGDTSYVAARDCAHDACTVAAIGHELGILRDHTRSDSDRAEALKFVVHFVGDLHQPLHGADNHDKGGNSVRVTFETRPTNLHSLWDSGILNTMGSEDQLVRKIQDEIAHRDDIAKLAESTPAQWAMESHDIARDVVYGQLPSSLTISNHYIDIAQPIIQERLLRAGVRLAALLNQTLGS